MSDADRHIWINAPRGDQTLWRYMDLLRFVDMIQRRTLWFTRLDQFTDPFEGQLTRPTEAFFRERRKFSGFRGGQNPDMARKLNCVNCWHISDHESEAMWKIYAKDTRVAIVSSISRLPDVFPPKAEGSWAIYGSPVWYVDYDRDQTARLDADGSIISIMESHCKRKNFEHEKEYRLVTHLEGEDIEAVGKHVPVILDKLIEKIYVSPAGPTWTIEVLNNLVRDHSLDVPVLGSPLYAKPK